MRDDHRRHPQSRGDCALTERDLSATTCVVFDVLRATSTMITALAHGAKEIYPVCTIDEAMSQAQWPHALLGGERHGEAIATSIWELAVGISG